MASKGKCGKADDKIATYRALFKQYDKNGDGCLSIHEFRDMLRSGGCNMSDRQIADSFVFFDGPKGDKCVNFDEFTKGLDQIVLFLQKLRELFDEVDTDRSGFLDRAELTSLLQRSPQKYSENEITLILQKADSNGDNKISFMEFVDACS